MVSGALILVVDDEPVNLSVMRSVLGGEYRLVFARSGAEALATAARHRPALVLLDVRLPDIDGYEVCRRLKQEAALAGAPVIFVTALSDEADEMAGFDAGGVDFIVKPVSAPVVRARVRTHLQLVRADRLEASYLEALQMLGKAGEYNDNDTGQHIWRMAAFAKTLALAAGWSPERAQLLEQAAPMHDLGKIGIPDQILKKPARLDAAEWQVMQRHSEIGAGILVKGHAPVFELAAEVALSHHERWDGSGYPAGLAGEAIPQSGRIVAIADVFDALTMKRPYKEAWPIDRVVQEIERGAGSHFDPTLVQLFLDRLDEILEVRRRWADPELPAAGRVAAD